jgi:methylenetetrahydrofolate reductase (NADPH)
LKSFRGALLGEGPALCATLPTGPNADVGDIVRQAEALWPTVHAIELTGRPERNGQVSPLALSARLLERGIDPIPWLDCRNHNRIALQSDLLGLRALGITCLVTELGKEPDDPEPASGKPVFDSDGPGLLAMVEAVNEEGWNGASHEFIPGVYIGKLPLDHPATARALDQAAEAGARFLVTAPCFNASWLRATMSKLVDARMTWKLSVIVTVAPVSSAAGLLRLGRLTGREIPSALIERLERSADPVAEGIEACAELMSEAESIPGVTGFRLLTPREPETVVSTISRVREKLGWPDRYF